MNVKTLNVKRYEPVKGMDIFSDFAITNKNINKYEIINGVYLRKNRLSTVITVDSYGNILNIEGENKKQYKIGDNIYEERN
jgi:hypothetical protein